MKIIQKNENKYILEPLKELLKSNGIEAKVDYEWENGRMKGPFVLAVDDDSYYKAIEFLDSIDTELSDYNDEIEGVNGKPTLNPRDIYKTVLKWTARAIILFVIIGIIYLLIKY